MRSLAPASLAAHLVPFEDNLFFQYMRPKIVAENEKEMAASPDVERLSFDELGRIIGRRWKELGHDDRKRFEEAATEDSGRYRKDMEKFQELKKKQDEEVAKQTKLEKLKNSDDKRLAARESGQAAFSANTSAPPPLSAFPVHSPTPLKARLPGSSPPPLSGAPPCPQQPIRSSLPTRFQLAPSAPWPGMPPHHVYPFPPPPSNGTFVGALSQLPSAPPNDLPVPPGMELYLPDPSGRDRKYTVKYSFYSMSRGDAMNYMRSLEVAALTPAPGPPEPPPPPSQLAHPPPPQPPTIQSQRKDAPPTSPHAKAAYAAPVPAMAQGR